MRLERALFILILADVVLCLVSVAGAEPAPTRFLGGLWLFVVGSTLAAWVGLLWRLRAARVLYLVAWLGYLALIALRGPAGPAGAADAMQLLLALNGGAILAVAWISDLRVRFVTFAQAFGGAPAVGA